VKGSSYGFVVTGTTAEGQLVARTSTGNRHVLAANGPARPRVRGVRVRRDRGAGRHRRRDRGHAASKISQQPVFLEAATDGTVRSVSLAGIAGATIPEMKINSTAVAGGLQIAGRQRQRLSGGVAAHLGRRLGPWSPRSGWSRPTPTCAR